MRFNWKIIFRILCWIYEHDYTTNFASFPEVLEMECGTCGHFFRRKGHKIETPSDLLKAYWGTTEKEK